MATGSVHSGIMAGKLKGTIAATTPSGKRWLMLSMPLATFRTVSPIMSDGIAKANSATSIPRLTSPVASPMPLPFSSVTSDPSSWKCSSSNALKRNRIWIRWTAGVPAHFGNAAAAAWTARSTSPAVPNGVWAITSPVAGLYTGSVGPAEASSQRPPMKCRTACCARAEPAGFPAGRSAVVVIAYLHLLAGDTGGERGPHSLHLARESPRDLLQHEGRRLPGALLPGKHTRRRDTVETD